MIYLKGGYSLGGLINFFSRNFVFVLDRSKIVWISLFFWEFGAEMHFSTLYMQFFDTKNTLYNQSHFFMHPGSETTTPIDFWGMVYYQKVSSKVVQTNKKNIYPKFFLLASLQGLTWFFSIFAQLLTTLLYSKPYLKSRLAWSFPTLGA